LVRNNRKRSERSDIPVGLGSDSLLLQANRITARRKKKRKKTKSKIILQCAPQTFSDQIWDSDRP